MEQEEEEDEEEKEEEEHKTNTNLVKMLEDGLIKLMKRKKLSVRRSTNKKTKSIWERLHKIHNFHHYCVYQLADDPISDMEESEGDSNESDMILDSDAGDSSSDSESNEDSWF